MQMDDIRSLELCELCDICASVGNVHLKEVFPAEAVGGKDAQTFPQKFERLCPVVSNGKHGKAVGLFVAHKHLDLDTVLFQGFHQSTGSNCSTSDTLRCINDEYSHCKIGCKGTDFSLFTLYFSLLFSIFATKIIME